MEEDQAQRDVALIGAMIGQEARAAMLDALMGGRWLTAAELTKAAEVAPSTGSEHLSRLVEGGLVVRRRRGRYIYHALSGPDVAEVLEGLGRVAFRTRHPSRVPPALRFARSCYDHLAGSLGVFVADALRDQGVVDGSARGLTENGAVWLGERLGLQVDDGEPTKRQLVRPCLDWSERRDHLAGSVGAALMAMMLEKRWLLRVDGTRALRLTVRGRDRLQTVLDGEIPEA